MLLLIEKVPIYKVWTIFTLLVFSSYIQYIHTSLHPSTFGEAPLHSAIADQLSGRLHPGGAEPGFELGPALQRADVLLTEPRRTLTEVPVL
jgi:hypothetical protein